MIEKEEFPKPGKQGKEEFPKPSEFNNKAVNLDIRKRQKLLSTFFIQNNKLFCQSFCQHSPSSNKANIVPKFSHILLTNGLV